MNTKSYNVLFLCTGNSARSILAEAILNRQGAGHFKAHSAGSHPTGWVNPLVLEQLAQAGISTDGLRSKSWNEFAGPDAPAMDFVFTVCDRAAGESCPIWPGRPVTAQWSIPDPASMPGTEAEKHRAFTQAFLLLQNRISLFLVLPLDKLDRMRLQRELDVIGKADIGMVAKP